MSSEQDVPGSASANQNIREHQPDTTLADPGAQNRKFVDISDIPEDAPGHHLENSLSTLTNQQQQEQCTGDKTTKPDFDCDDDERSLVDALTRLKTVGLDDIRVSDNYNISNHSGGNDANPTLDGRKFTDNDMDDEDDLDELEVEYVSALIDAQREQQQRNRYWDQGQTLTKRISRSVASSIIGGSSLNGDHDEDEDKENGEAEEFLDDLNGKIISTAPSKRRAADSVAGSGKLPSAAKLPSVAKRQSKFVASDSSHSMRLRDTLKSLTLNRIGGASAPTATPNEKAESQKIFSFSLPFGDSLMNIFPSVRIPKLKFFSNDSNIRFITTQNYDKHELKDKLKRNNSLSTLEEAYLYKDFKGADNSRLRAVRKALTPNIAIDAMHYISEKKTAIKLSGILPYTSSSSNNGNGGNALILFKESYSMPSDTSINTMDHKMRDRIFYGDTVFNQLEGDIVILGGYRGSILRDKETGRRVWIPIKVGLNLRKVDLVVGPQDEDEYEMENKVYADGMLKNVGPIDISKKLIKKFKSVPNTRVHEFGYDWRLSSDINSDKLQKFLESLPGNKVSGRNKKRKGALVVAHSMGGLIAHHVMNKDPSLFNGLLYMGAPTECLNILGPIRFGDAVLLSKTVLTDEANFLMRSSFVFLPRHGKVFYDKNTGKFIQLDLFDPDTWVKYNLSPLVSQKRKDVDERLQKRLLCLQPNKSKEEGLKSRYSFSGTGSTNTLVSGGDAEKDLSNRGHGSLAAPDINGTQFSSIRSTLEAPSINTNNSNNIGATVNAGPSEGQLLSTDSIDNRVANRNSINSDSHNNNIGNYHTTSLLRFTPIFNSPMLRADSFRKSIAHNMKRSNGNLAALGSHSNHCNRSASGAAGSSTANSTLTNSDLILAKEKEREKDNVATPKVYLMSWQESYEYLARTLKRTKKFISELEYKLELEAQYPPLAVVYGNKVPSVRGVFVDGEKDIMEGNYGDFFYGPGDGVIHQRWLLPENVKGFETVAKVPSDCGHVSLLTDIEAVGRALSEIIKENKKRRGSK